jgi:hypothetical protein
MVGFPLFFMLTSTQVVVQHLLFWLLARNRTVAAKLKRKIYTSI